MARNVTSVKSVTSVKIALAASFLALFFLVGEVSAQSASCAKTCVTVTREGGELVITARRDPILRPPKPIAAPSPSPTPSARPSISSGTPTRTPVRKRAPQRSLSDEIREVLPHTSFAVLPKAGAVIHEPLLVRALGCAPFQKTLPILDTSIHLNLYPTIEWSWGDGSVDRWRGAAERGVHIFSRPGRYLIAMSCEWSGAYRTPESPWAPIPSGITSIATQSVELFRARVFFTD